MVGVIGIGNATAYAIIFDGLLRAQRHQPRIMVSLSGTAVSNGEEIVSSPL